MRPFERSAGQEAWLAWVSKLEEKYGEEVLNRCEVLGRLISDNPCASAIELACCQLSGERGNMNLDLCGGMLRMLMDNCDFAGSAAALRKLNDIWGYKIDWIGRGLEKEVWGAELIKWAKAGSFRWASEFRRWPDWETKGMDKWEGWNGVEALARIYVELGWSDANVARSAMIEIESTDKGVIPVAVKKAFESMDIASEMIKIKNGSVPRKRV